jgi:hypothetical protein
MDMLGITNPTTPSLGGPAKLESEVQTIRACREWELKLTICFQPPDLLEIRHRLEPICEKT